MRIGKKSISLMLAYTHLTFNFFNEKGLGGYNAKNCFHVHYTSSSIALALS
jgi:hypothetical protein